MTDARRAIPSIGGLLEREEVRALLAAHPRSVVVDAARRAVDEARKASGPTDAAWDERIAAHIELIERRSLRPAFNATGVILHTNLGRAPLAAAAIAAINDIASGYSNLEYDLSTGARGSRYVHCVAMLQELTGAEDAIVVNNCASALVLSLSALARDREVIVSRGELVEIGGSFRVPDIMARSGATLVEIGTTNRTHLDDYVRAITSRTGAIAKIHRSNFSQSGFVADVEVESLTRVASEHGIPIVHDLGSGLMLDLSEYGLSGEPTARAALEAGATLVLMSGDKLLGGPQAGIVLGARHAIARLRQDPFARAMRVDKLTIAALTATLELYREPETALREIPALAMISSSAERIRARCERLRESLSARGIQSRVVESTATVGAGAFPSDGVPSFAVAMGGDAVRMESALRLSSAMPVIGHIVNDELLLEMRSVPERDDPAFIAAVEAALR
jgi:L-seryl-tRNA(Ser) seleniumtransferase